MLSPDLRKLLIAQIGNELGAHQLYMGIALYFERQSLDGWGKLFRDQSVEEAQHAAKIMDFLTDNEVEFDLPALKATSTRFKSPLGRGEPGARVRADGRRSVRRDGGRRRGERRPPRSPVPPVVHRGAGRGGGEAAGASSTSSTAGSTCSRPRPCSIASSERGAPGDRARVR